MRARQMAACGVVLLVGLGCGREAEHGAPADLATAAVQTVAVRAAQVPVLVTAAGSTEPYARATLSTRLMGRITQVAVEAGDAVQPGRALVRIESDDLTARHRQVEAGLGEAEAALTNATRTQERMRSLRQDNVVSQQVLDDAETARTRAELAVAAARQGVREVEVSLGYCQVQAPWRGVVVQKLAQVGDLASPGMPLLVVEQQDSMKVTVEVNESQAACVTVGQQADVRVEALGAQAVCPGRVESVVPAADPATRTFQVRLVVPNADRRVASGMFARVSFPRGQRAALLVPRAAIVEQGQLQGVFVVLDGRARLHWVRLGVSYGDDVEVLSGLDAGADVVVGEPGAVRDGQPVEVRGHA